jgi:flagellar protein FlaJ
MMRKLTLLRIKLSKIKLTSKITRNTIKWITIISSIAGLIFIVISILVYLTDPVLDYMIVIGFTIAVTPPGVASLVHSRWKGKIEKSMPEFLRDLATSHQTGMPLQLALEHASKRNYGPLTAELKIMVAHMSWGMNFDEALKEFSQRIDLPVVEKATVLILEAARHGGDLSDIFNSTAKYVDNVNAWTDRRKMQTLPYVAIFYFSVALFLFIIIIISNMIFIPMSEMETGGITVIQPVLTPLEARRVFLHAALLESLFGGLLAGKINEDSFQGGLKHTAVLAAMSGIAFYIFLN